MTLNIHYLTGEVSFQSSDFCLTDSKTLQPLRTPGLKSVVVNRPTWDALVCFAGVAQVGTTNVGEWLGQRVFDLARDARPSDLIDSLTTADAWLGRVRLDARILTFTIVGYADGVGSTITLVTTIDHLSARRASAPSPSLYVETLRITTPTVFVTGVAVAFTRQMRKGLIRMAGRDKSEISVAIADLNRSVSLSLGGRYVSEACFVSLVEPSGRTAGMAYGVDAETEDFVPADIAAELQARGQVLKPRVGPDGSRLPVRVRQFASQRTGLTGARVIEFQNADVE